MKPAHRSLLIVLIVLVALAAQLPAQSSSEDTVVFEVSGMWAESCEEYVTRTLLGDIEGIKTATADAASGEVTVTFDSAITDPDALARAIEKCPLLEVEGSATHDLAERPRREGSCCSGSICQIEGKNVA